MRDVCVAGGLGWESSCERVHLILVVISGFSISLSGIQGKHEGKVIQWAVIIGSDKPISLFW